MRLFDSDKYVSRELFEQYKGERDIAISQLNDLGIELGEKVELKAIPIEWLKNKADEQHTLSFYMGNKPITIDELIVDWRKENER